jgi:hypothetical protein
MRLIQIQITKILTVKVINDSILISKILFVPALNNGHFGFDRLMKINNILKTKVFKIEISK